jgi:3-dehydroquinate dehydratase
VIAEVVSHRISGRGAEGYRDAFTYIAENAP